MMEKGSEFRESLYPDWGQFFIVDELLHEQRSDHHHLVIFQNTSFGRVLALDGVIQTTERDEFIYHEMMSHVPLFAHPDPKRVLIVGGGDGGMLREVLRHPNVEAVTQVEIDRAVIDMCVKYLPNHSQGAFDDPRVEIVIEDGLDFVSRQGDRFDVIISDATDPIGPGEALFKTDFYAGCHQRLEEGGVMVAQNGNAFQQLDEVTTTALRLASLNAFTNFGFYAAAVPTYVGSIMAFAWAARCDDFDKPSLETLERRFGASAVETQFYTPALHAGSFALPRYVERALEQALGDRV